MLLFFNFYSFSFMLLDELNVISNSVATLQL